MLVIEVLSISVNYATEKTKAESLQLQIPMVGMALTAKLGVAFVSSKHLSPLVRGNS